MKLDLINSRIHVNLGPRIYDSIEGEHIKQPADSPKLLSKASFLSKQHRLDYEPKSKNIPDRFNVSVVDSHGNFLPLDKTKRVLPKHISPSKPRASFQELQKNEKQEKADPFAIDKYPSKIVDYMKDHIYEVKEDSVENRLKAGLPGAAWDVTGRKHTPPKYKIGPGDYEIYNTNLTNRGWMVQRGGQFNDQPSGREHDEENDPNFFPLKERQRYQRKKAAEEEKLAKAMRSISPNKCLSLLSNSISAHSESDMGTLASIGAGSVEGSLSRSKSSANIKSSLGGSGMKDRFDDKIYKQEFFVKTSGMKLPQDWDKKLNKKIAFSFQPPSHTSPKKKIIKSEGADVDVDVGHMFSIVHTAKLSPIKYSAAFRSSAKVGMEIPVPTSGTEIGPGSFPGALTPAMEIKQPDRPSHFILLGRPDITRQPIPDLTEPTVSFADRHRSGPVFDKQKVGGGNIVLQEIVKEKMKKIYPRLAESKFPAPPRSTLPSPWGRKKIK